MGRRPRLAYGRRGERERAPPVPNAIHGAKCENLDIYVTGPRFCERSNCISAGFTYFSRILYRAFEGRFPTTKDSLSAKAYISDQLRTMCHKATCNNCRKHTFPCMSLTCGHHPTLTVLLRYSSPAAGSMLIFSNREDHLVGLWQPHPRRHGQRTPRAMVHLRSESRESRSTIPAQGNARTMTSRLDEVVDGEVTGTRSEWQILA